jgi:DNA polymerase III subunit beta
MDIVASKKDLFRLVQHCQGVADKKSAMPALANVLFTTTSGAIQVAATDLYVSVVSSAPCEVHRPGTVAVPARDVLERIKAMPEGPVQITSNDAARTDLRAVGSPRRYTLHGLPGADFPEIPAKNPSAPTLDLPVDVLSRLIARTHFSISPDETRANVNSALLEWSGDRIRMVTTDGHRLSKAEEAEVPTSATATMLVPLKAVNELRRLADEAKAEGTTNVNISQNGPNAFFTFGDTQFTAKLVEASFPPYQQVIPAASSRKIVLPRGTFADALKAVSLASSDRTGAVKFALGKNLLRITSESPESGNALDEVVVDYDGDELSIGFNAKYFLDVLASLDTEQVQLGLSGQIDPGVVRLVEPGKHDFVAVVMPMRI